jgi:hypothetical protein
LEAWLGSWETQKETMKKYFEQFGEILEAAVITDKATGRSKGYGFVFCFFFFFFLFAHISLHKDSGICLSVGRS